MQVEIRSDHAVIKGYVNAVERDSREMRMAKENFVEQVCSGAWNSAISKNEDIPLLLNHDKLHKLASTKDSTLKLAEDNIGLYAEARVYDSNVIESAKNNNLVGWSFGFQKLKDSWGKTDSGIDRRYLDEINLTEISVLDNTRTPAYYGTSIESRDNKEISIEQRTVLDASEVSKKNTEDGKEAELKLKLLELELEI